MPLEDMIAIAFVVDSSVVVASEWPRIIPEYVMQMLRRLGETNPPGIRFRMAFVTYGTQGTPLICKNFFTDIGPVMQAFKEDTSRLGIGQTTCGGGTGMAALEGFVAAIELFDLLKQKAQPKNPSFPPVYHIFHVAAAQPDCSEHPQLNFSASLDDVTWKSLPSELKKRNIHLSSINVRPKLPKFSELHSTCSTSPVAPWFPVRPQHTVLLSGYASLPQKGVKRPGEPLTVERTPDPKRIKPNTDTSPKTPNTLPAPQRSHTPAKVPTPTPPAPMAIRTPSAPPPSTTPAVPPMAAPVMPPQLQIPPHRIQQIHNALRATEQPVRALEAAITDARAKGNTQLLDTLIPQWTEKNNTYLKLKQNIQNMLQTQRAAYAHAQQMQAAQQGQAAQQTLAAQQAGQQEPAGQQAQVVPQGQTSQQNDGDSQKGVVDSSNNNNSSNMMPPQPQPPPQQLPQQQPQQPVPSTSELSMPGHMRSLSGGGLGTQQLLGMPMGVNINPGGVGPSPMITQQMQKLIEQKDRARQNQITHKQTSVPVWQGLVTWSGLNPAGEQREVSSFVIASSTTLDTCHAKTWPTTLTLTLSRENAVPMRDLQAWMKVVQPALCTFQANPRANNPTHNEMAYKSLVAMLLTKNLYFIGAWALPNGQHSKTVLFFPVHNAGLVGAFFPLTGFADMPPSLQPQLPNAGGSAPNQSSPVPIPNPNPVANPPPQNQQGLVQPQMTGVSGTQLMAQIDNVMKTNGIGLPPAFVVQLTKMNPVDRNRTMMTIIRNGQEQARQKAAAQNAALGNTNLPQGQQPGMTMGMGQLAMMQQAMGQQQQQGMGQQQQQQGMGQQQQGMGQQQQGIGQQQQGIGQQQQGIGQQQQQPGMGQQQQQGMSQQQQQQQTDMGAFNPAQFGLGGGAAMGGGGMPGGMGGMGGAMGGALGMGGNPGMYSDMMATASLPRSVSGGSGGGGGVSYEMMQSFMQRNQEISGGSGSGG